MNGERFKILVVDDDRSILTVLSMRLESAGYEVITAINGDEAKKAVKENSVDLAIIDQKLENEDGIELMQEIHLIVPELPVIILTAYGTIDSAVEAIKKGAYTYITKPFDPKNLLMHIDKALESRRLTFELENLRQLLHQEYSFSNIVAKSEKMREILKLVSQIAPTDSTVFIHGESGTGKELIAKAIHLASHRSKAPFVAINCAALPETLLESELFGYEKGAFTGAIKSTKGIFSRAHKGTIFLDEIGDMSLSVQAKFLRVLQEKKFYPLGSEHPIEVDVRIIVATNKDLWKEVEQGNFRRDLFYRIHVIPIHLPPLRERREDIPLLVDHFIKKYSKKMSKKIKKIDPKALKKLMLYDWPGNIRELENVVEYAIVMTESEIIGEEHIILPEDVDSKVKTFKEAKAEFEKNYLRTVLKITRGNVSQAAALAGKYRADFYKLLRKYNLDPKSFKEVH